MRALLMQAVSKHKHRVLVVGSGVFVLSFSPLLYHNSVCLACLWIAVVIMQVSSPGGVSIKAVCEIKHYICCTLVILMEHVMSVMAVWNSMPASWHSRHDVFCIP